VPTYRTIDLARAAGVHPNTVRLYERIGFISPAPRAANGYRVFGEQQLCQLRICRCIFDYSFLGQELRRASLEVIRAAGAWDLPRARRCAEEYLGRVERELAVARQTADILARWARGTRRAKGGRTYTRGEMAEQIGVTEEALRNWERNGLLRVPRVGANRTRVYGEAERERLRVIYMLRQSGYSMSAIHHSLRRYDEGDPAGVIEALGTVESAEGATWARDHWIEALEGARQGAEQILFLLEEARAGKEIHLRKPSIDTPPLLLPLRWAKRREEEPPMSWQDALRTVLELTYERVEKEGIAWALIDAGAANLQGARVPPHLRDGFCIMTEQAAGVFRFAELLLPITPEGEETAGPRKEPGRSTRKHTVFVGDLPSDRIAQRLPAGRSTRKAPVSVGPGLGLDWHWATWTIHHAEVTVVHVDASQGHPNHRSEGGVWEMDPAIWPHVRRVAFDRYSVPVVPLEILAAHYLAGDHMESPEEQFYNTAEIARVFRANGYDRALLEWAIRPADLPRFDAILRDQGRECAVPSTNTIFVQVADRPARKLILKRGVRATHYYEYCDEVGCEVGEELAGIQRVLSEDRLLGFWLPPHLRKPGTSAYVMGIEVPADYRGAVPAGFDVIALPACKMMFFQGPRCKGEPPRDPVRDAMDSYDVKFHGYEWADEEGPRFQLPPRGDRGYIEARPVRPLRRK